MLVNSRCIYTRINKQLDKKEKIKTESIDQSFKIFNTDRTKNREVIWYVLLKFEINRYKEQINVVIIDLNSMNIFLEYNWLIKFNLEVN